MHVPSLPPMLDLLLFFFCAKHARPVPCLAWSANTNIKKKKKTERISIFCGLPYGARVLLFVLICIVYFSFYLLTGTTV